MLTKFLFPFNISTYSLFICANLRLISLFFFLLFFSPFVISSEYVWVFTSTPSASNLIGTSYNSPMEACTFADGKRTNNQSSERRFKFLSLRKESETVFACDGEDWVLNQNPFIYKTPYTFGKVTRQGTSCPQGTIYNDQTGACDQDCSNTLDDYLLLRGPDSSVFNSNGVNYISSTSDSVSGSCSQGCGYEPTSSFGASCYLVSGSTNTGYCNYIVRGTGESCSAQNITPGDMSGDPLNGPPDPGPDPDPDPDPQPDPCHGVPGFTWNGSTCIPTPGDGPGDGDGGGDNGGGDNGGGGNNGGGDSGGGDSGGGDSGGGDTGGGDSGGGTPGTGDGSGGTGDGDCTGDDCGDDEESSASGTDCNQALQCSGDAIQCAILQQQKQQRCYAEEMGDFESQRSAIESMFSGEEYTMDEEEIEVPSFISQGTRFLPASCPPPVAIALSGRTYQLSLEPWCFFADALGYLIVAFAALAGALYVGRAFGGG